MASIFALQAFDQSALNFHDLFIGAKDAVLEKNANLREGDLFFRDTYGVLWERDGEEYLSGFLGENFSVDGSDVLNGGTVQGYIKATWTGFDYSLDWMAVGLTLSVTEIYAAVRTASRADDQRIIDKALSGNDEFQLSDGNDRANGKAGNDIIRAGAGNDTIGGGVGNDQLFGEAGNDHLYLDRGNDLLNGGTGNDWVIATGKTNVTVKLFLKGGQNTGMGQDTILGVENVAGGAGNDRLHGNALANTLKGGAGNDRLYGRAGDDLLQGGAGNDYINGGPGNDTLQGGAGNDTLIGDLGFDVLRGGAGAGADVFVFHSIASTSTIRERSDIIRDFQQGQDKIDLRPIDASVSLAGNNAFEFLGNGPIGTSAAGSVTYVKLDRAGTANDITLIRIDNDSDAQPEALIRLNGLYDLTADDFFL